MIHFKCCEEGAFFPCHKCHNEAIEKENELALEEKVIEENVLMFASQQFDVRLWDSFSEVSESGRSTIIIIIPLFKCQAKIAVSKPLNGDTKINL